MSEWLQDARWFCDALDVKTNQAHFVHTDRDSVCEAPFLDHRWVRSGLKEHRVDLAALSFLELPQAPRFIWHTAFCGSTLLARCLDKAGVSLALREPDALMHAASIQRHRSAQEAQLALKVTLALLLRGFEAGERVTLKPTNAANNMMQGAFALHPEGRSVFLTSQLRHFLLSIAKKGEAGRAFIRQLFSLFLRDGHPLANSEPSQLLGLTDLQIAALVWHLQIDGMRAAAHAFPGHKVLWVEDDAFLDEPAAILKAVCAHLDIPLSDEECQSVANGPLLQKNSKLGDVKYTPQKRLEERDAIAAHYGEELDMIITWSYTIFPDNPRQGEAPWEQRAA